MEKLSSILPGNARIHKVDLDEAHAARPGAPGVTLGQPRGFTASERDRVTFSSTARENALRSIDEILHPEGQASPEIKTPAQNQVQQVQIQNGLSPNIEVQPQVNETLAELSGASINKYA